MPEINLENVSFGYNEHLLFENMSHKITGTGIYTLTGPSGCGKTTYFRLLLKLISPKNGTIYLSEAPSMLFQEHRLFPNLSVIDNLTVITAKHNKQATENLASDLLGKLGLSEKTHMLFPHELSGGMRQRVAIARALFSDSKILLLDEPSKELDAALRENLYDLLTARAKNSLILMSTHRTEEGERLASHAHPHFR